MFRERALPLALVLGAVRAHGAWGVAYPPADPSAPRPAIVYLHGMWASPEDSCGLFEKSATALGFLVCPRGNAPLNDGRMWAGTYASVAPSLHAALDAAAKGANGPAVLDRSAPGTMMGYSNGAYFAAEVAQAEPGKWSGLVLLSMHLDLDPARLKAAGVKRVVFGAADKDGARDSMKALAEKLQGGGVSARFVGLGPGGHELPSDLDARMCEPIAWVREASAAACAR
jgi:predicted esterase